MPEVVVAGDFDASHADAIAGLHGTIGEQPDEAHYDQRCGADDDLEKGKIHFPAGQLYGRQRELDELRSIYDEVASVEGAGDCSASSARTTRRVVFLGGLSGVGKSALVEEMVKRVTEDQNRTERPERRPLFGAGKFSSQSAQVTPFSALSEAFAGWSTQLLDRTQDPGEKDGGGRGEGIEELRQVRKNLKKVGLGTKDEGCLVMVGLFPALSSLLLYKEDEGNDDGDCDGDENSDIDDSNMPRAKSKTVKTQDQGTPKPSRMRRTKSDAANLGAVKIVVQNFIIALCRNQIRPVVMFIDDCQWADQASLDVMSAILTNDTLEHFFFIGSYRSNEVNDDEHPLAKCMAQVEKSAGDAIVRRIEIANLSPSDVAQFIADCTEKDVEDVGPFANLVYTKTLGNIFYVRCSLEELVRKNILYFDVICYEWQYNLKLETEIHSFVNEDFTSMIKSRIAELEDKDRRALVLAAYTRNVFDVGTVHALLCADGSSIDEYQVRNILDRAIKEGLLLNSRLPTEYRFAHDKIQETSYDCVPPGADRDLLQSLVGVTLLSRYESIGDEWMLFVAVNHLNAVPRKSIDVLPEEKLAKMNLDAANLASSKANISQAASYLRHGMKYLDSRDGWKQHYKLRLDILNGLLKAETSLGNYDEAAVLVDEVLSNAACLGDKAVAHMCLLQISAYKNDGDYNAGVDMGTKLAKEYGCEIPKHPGKLYLFVQRHRTKIKHCCRPLIGLVNQPIMKDEAIMEIFSFILGWSFVTQRVGVADAVLHRALEIAYSKGISPGFAKVIGQCCIGLVKQGHFQAAHNYSDLAVEIMKRFPEKQCGPDYAEFQFKLRNAMHTRYPYREDIACFHQYYNGMVAGGNVQFGLGSAMVYTLSYVAAGLPLCSILQSRLIMYEQSCKELGHKSFAFVFQVMHQFLLNLLSKANSNPTVFEGAALNEEEALKPIEGNQKKMALRDVSTFRLQLAYIFCDKATMNQMIDRLKSYPLFDLITSRQHLRISFLGLAALEVGKSENNKEYLKLGKTIMKEMRRLTRGGSLNAHPVYLCLKATDRPSKERYEKAIEACSNSSMIHLEAMTNERYAGWFRGQGDEENAKDYLVRAYSRFNDWGAKDKMKQLCELHPFLKNASVRKHFSLKVLSGETSSMGSSQTSG